MGMISLNFDFGTKLLNKSNPTKAPTKRFLHQKAPIHVQITLGKKPPLSPFSKAELVIENMMAMPYGYLIRLDLAGSMDLYQGIVGLIHWVYQNLSSIYNLI